MSIATTKAISLKLRLEAVVFLPMLSEFLMRLGQSKTPYPSGGRRAVIDEQLQQRLGLSKLKSIGVNQVKKLIQRSAD